MKPNSVLPSGNKVKLQQVLRAVEALVRSGDMPRATQMASQAVSDGQEHFNLFVLAAYGELNRGLADRALVLAKRARDLAPRNIDALTVLGLAQVRLKRLREAITTYDSALRQAPSAAHLHFNKACALEDLNEIARARIEYERTVALQPSHAEALARLAFLSALRGDTSAARDYARHCLRHDPNAAAARLALASADIQDRAFEQAIAMLHPLARDSNPSAINRAMATGLMGDALDGLDRVPEAFAAYAASNDILRGYYRAAHEAPEIESAQQRVKRLTAYFGAAPVDAWRSGAQGQPGERKHIFLVGFPRSGTTLLEQILDSHPDIEAMSERDCLLDGIDAFILPADGLDRLVVADDAVLENYRQSYWRKAGEYGHAARKKVFVDKMPLNSVLLCLVAKLFPQAKVLLAIRDPRDVVFSCFRRRFGMTQQMYELLTLDGAAAYYDAVMTLSELYRTKIELDVHELRYESIVGAFDSEIAKLCAFLGVAFDESMHRFGGRARANSVDTPSSSQVVRGIYTDGIRQWRRYRDQLKPVLPRLAPWVARFGYEEG